MTAYDTFGKLVLDDAQDELVLDEAHKELLQLRQNARLLAENVELKHALKTRELIGRATGILAVTANCSVDQASRMLVQQSQHANWNVCGVAQRIVLEHGSEMLHRDLAG